MKLLARPGADAVTLQDRLVWQAASLLLAYPDEHHADRLRTVERLCAGITGAAAQLLARTVAALRASDPMTCATDYVETFDLRKRATLYLTYWTSGDTRNRGREMHVFAEVYRESGAHPPVDESPDHLSVVLEFAATVDPVAGRRLLVKHRVPVDVVCAALSECGSPYVHPGRRVQDVAPGYQPRGVTRAAARAGRPAHGSGWAGTVHADGATPPQ